MLELPEVKTLSRQVTDSVTGRKVRRVLPPTKAGRFCFYSGDPDGYDALLRGRTLVSASGFGIFMEMDFSGVRMCVNDGVRMQYIQTGEAPASYQLLMELDDGSLLSFSIAMYGGIYVHNGDFDNEYYHKSRDAVDIFSPEFEEYFNRLIESVKPSQSAKALLATYQRVPGLGNGCLQDVLLRAGITPRHKVGDISDRGRLLRAIVDVMGEMVIKGGRDTERDLFGNPGGYVTMMSKNNDRCPICGCQITRETYLGGSVYYCPSCQK